MSLVVIVQTSAAQSSSAYTRDMPFDHELAQQLMRRKDRDTAPFFAGRVDEIRRFDDALRALEDFDGLDARAVFRIYQGAPGCGKTSLITHLRKVRPTEIGLFVDIQLEDLRSISALTQRVRSEAERQGSAKGTKIVLHMDEAQVVEASAQPGLLMLHTRGLGVPCICVLTGLGHTADRLSSIAGLSRLSSDAVVNMGPMSEDECAESTRMILDACRTHGGDDEKRQAAASVAGLSRGWPQHLHGAQSALCREMLRNQGSLDDVDWDRVRSESDRSRQEYYHRRLFNTVLDMVPDATAQIVSKVRQERPQRLFDLEGLCEAEIGRMGLDRERRFRATPEEFAVALVERGVLAITPEGWYDIAIPSMGEWIARGSNEGYPP